MFKFNKMKWLAGVLMILGLVTVLLLPGCQSAPPAAPSAAPSAAASQAAKPAQPTAAAVQAQYHWTSGIHVAKDTPQSTIIDLLCDLIQMYSKGRIAVDKRFYAGAVGGGDQLPEKLQKGDIDIAWNYPYPTTNPKFIVGSAPGIMGTFPQYEALYTRYKGGIIDKIIRKGNEDVGIKVILSVPGNFYGVTTISKPVRTPAELKGLKIRAKEDPIVVETMKKLGALPTVMASGEVYTAMQTKTIDGSYCESIDLTSKKYYEVSKYYTDINWWGTAQTFAMPLKLYNSLPDDLKQAVNQAEWVAERFAWTYWHDEDAKAWAFLKGKGMTIINLTDAERKAFFDIMKPEELWEKLIKPVLSADEYAQFKAEVARVNKEY